MVIGSEPLLIPAGSGCSFDVGVEPDDDARQAIMEFSDGRLQVIGHANPTLTNLETDDSLVQRSRYRVTQTYDSEANDLLLTINGRVFFSFVPDDRGPVGTVGEPGAFFSVIGRQSVTFDLDTGLVSAYSLDGRAGEICSLLS
jgi:hypothetical protein